MPLILSSSLASLAAFPAAVTLAAALRHSTVGAALLAPVLALGCESSSDTASPPASVTTSGGGSEQHASMDASARGGTSATRQGGARTAEGGSGIAAEGGRGVNTAAGQGSGTTPPVSETRPNVLILYADDLGYGDIRAFNADSRIPTPNVDKLASEGLMLTDAHSSSGICSPSRFALLTGQYHFRRTHSIVGAMGGPLLYDSDITLAELLRDAGYATAAMGKWHLGWSWNAIYTGPAGGALQNALPDAFDWSRPVPGGPLSHGFDHYFGDGTINLPPYGWIRDDKLVVAPSVPYKEPTRPPPEGRWESRGGPAVAGWDQWQVLPTLAKEGVSWLRSRADQKQPFFLYFAFPSPHAPILPTADYAGLAQAGPYGDFVAMTDAIVGDLLAALEQAGLKETTLVIFTSDNGPEVYQRNRRKPATQGGYDHSSPGVLRGEKRHIWEGGHRVPFVVRYPGVVPAGESSAALISQIDILATVTSFAGVELPSTAGPDSLDMTALMQNPKAASPRTELVHNTGASAWAPREQHWVLLDGSKYANAEPRPAGSPAEANLSGPRLFNLQVDLEQQNDVAASEAARVEQLRQVLRRHQSAATRPGAELLNARRR